MLRLSELPSSLSSASASHRPPIFLQPAPKASSPTFLCSIAESAKEDDSDDDDDADSGLGDSPPPSPGFEDEEKILPGKFGSSSAELPNLFLPTE